MLITARSIAPPRRGPAIAWSASLLAHALLVAGLLHVAARRPETAPAAPRIDFMLVPAHGMAAHMPAAAVPEAPAATPPAGASAAVAGPTTGATKAPSGRRAASANAAVHRDAMRSTRAAAAAGGASASATAPVFPSAAVPDTSQAAAPADTSAAGSAPGAPDPGTPAEAAPATGRPAFDMAAARRAARAAAHGDKPGLVTLPDRPPPTIDPVRDSRMEAEARDAARPNPHDCRVAYAGMGLLAILPLVKDAVTGSGCKW